MSLPALRFKEFVDSWQYKNLLSLSENGFTNGVFNDPAKVGSGYKLVNVLDMYIETTIDETKLKLVDIDEAEFIKNKVEHGDVFFTRSSLVKEGIAYSNTYLGYSEDITFDGHLIRMRPKKDLIDSRFLNYLLRTSSPRSQLVKRGKTATMTTIGQADIAEVVIKFPSKAEQSKIANFLTAVDEKISILTQKHDLLTQYKKGVMQQIFSQELRFKDDDGQDFPEWEEATLGEIAKFRRGSFPQPYGLAKWYDDIKGMPFIQVFDVDDNFRLKDKTKRLISKEAQQQSVFVKTGSILITIQGSIGRIAVTQYDAYVDRTLLLFESFKVKINKHYFAYILFLLFEIEKEKAPGGIIKTITKEVLTDFKVFICDYEEQTKIANFLTAIDDKITATQTQLLAVKQYKQGLLQQMFI